MTTIETHVTRRAGLESSFDAAAPYLGLIGRLMIAAIFIQAGLQKIPGYAGTAGYMDAMGVPSVLLPAVIAVEILGGLAIVIGWQTRLFAFLLAGFSVMAGILFHFQPDDQIQMIMLFKNIAIAGGFLFLVVNGPGAFALDNRRR